MQIESVNNPKIKNLIKLKEKKYRDLTNTFIVEGEHLVKEALKKELVIEIYSLSDEDYGVPSFKITEAVMKKITSQVSISPIIALCKKMGEEPIKGPVLILDGIQDPGNLGTIIRSAVAFSMPNIIISDNSVDLYNPKVIRSTQGMIFKINLIKDDLGQVIEKLKSKNIPIYTTNVNGGENIKNINTTDSYGLIMGNEGNGVKDEISTLADRKIYIPMNSKVESLNVSVAASILLYELGDKNG